MIKKVNTEARDGDDVWSFYIDYKCGIGKKSNIKMGCSNKSGP